MSKTILILEEQDFLRQTLRDWLEITFPPFQIAEAINPAEILSLAKSRPPAIILISMPPAMDKCFETVRQLKAVLPASKIVILNMIKDEAFQALIGAGDIGPMIPLWELVPTNLQQTLLTLLPPETPQSGQTTRLMNLAGV